MIAAAERAISYTRGIAYDDFLDDIKTQDAAVMNLIVLAEASKGVPESLKDTAPEIPWGAIEGFRNRAAHSGQTLDLSLDISIVWQICTRELENLLPKLRELLRGQSEILG